MIGKICGYVSRLRNLALLMIALGPDAASTLLKRFDAKDAENICKKIGDFPIVEQELQECVLDEFFRAYSNR